MDHSEVTLYSRYEAELAALREQNSQALGDAARAKERADSLG